MGAAASSSGTMEQVCYGYWDTSTKSIHMVRLNSIESTSPSSPSSSSASSVDGDHDLIEELQEEEEEGDDDGEVPDQELIPAAARSKGRKLSTEITTMPKRFKLLHTGYAKLQCKESEERRLSGVKLQEMETVDMPLKAAKILVGNPMRLKIDKDYADSDEDAEVPITGHFDIVSVCNKSTSTCVRLPQLSKARALVQSSKHSTTVLTSTDTQITMVLPRKAAKLLLGETQVKTNTPSSATSRITDETSISGGKFLQASLSRKPVLGSS